MIWISWWGHTWAQYPSFMSIPHACTRSFCTHDKADHHFFGNLMKKQIPNAKVSRTIKDNQRKKNLVLPCNGSSHDADDDKGRWVKTLLTWIMYHAQRQAERLNTGTITSTHLHIGKSFEYSQTITKILMSSLPKKHMLVCKYLSTYTCI